MWLPCMPSKHCCDCAVTIELVQFILLRFIAVPRRYKTPLNIS